MMMDIESIKTLTIEPDESLVITMSKIITIQDKEDIAEMIGKSFNCKVLVLDPDTTVSKVKIIETDNA